MGKRLSEVEIKHFADVGFLRVPAVIPPDLIIAAKSSLETDLKRPSGPYYKDTKGMAYKLYGLLERGSAYEDIIRMPILLDVLEDLLGPDLVYTRNRHNHGSLNQTGHNADGLHRDVLRGEYVSVIVYLEEVTPENGPTIVIPGSHRWSYAPDQSDGIFLDSIAFAEYRGLAVQAVPILAGPGDLLLFEGVLFHTAQKNTSGKTRASLVLGYRAVDELNGVIDRTECLVRGRDLYRGNVVVPRRS